MSLEENEECIFILASVANDASIAAKILQRAGIAARTFSHLKDLIQALEGPVGALLIGEEAIEPDNYQPLKDRLSLQPTWSDLPIILLSSLKERIFSTQKILDVFNPCGNISVLEKPFRINTFISATRVALRARQRQYQTRSLILSQEVALQRLDDFLSIAGHELKTPLTNLQLQTQIRERLIKRGDTSVFEPEKITALIQITKHQVLRLTHLVDDMLDVSRISNGKLSLNCEKVNLQELVGSVINDFASQMQAANCVLEFHCENEICGDWDRYRLEQVVTNLITNAIKYGSGKPVRISLSLGHESSEGQGLQEYALLQVQDHGMGIAPENHTRVFGRFERAVSCNNINGLGLGLYISGQIVLLHHGKIWVESELGQGSTFKVALPTTTGAQAESHLNH